MRSFSFRLERILRLRADAERHQARRLGEATQEEARLDAMARDQAAYLEQIGEQMAPAPGERASAGWLRALALTADAAAQQLEEAERSRASARESVEHLRERLRDARVERRSLEKLRERHVADFDDAVRLDERKTMDEIAGRRHGGGEGT